LGVAPLLAGRSATEAERRPLEPADRDEHGGTTNYLGEAYDKVMTRPPKGPHLGVALAIALVCLANAGVARAQVVGEPVTEAPVAPVDPPAGVPTPVSEPPAEPTEPPAAEVPTPVSEPPAEPTEPPAAEVPTPVSEPPAEPTEPPAADVPTPVSKPPAPSGNGNSIVVITSGSTTPGIDAAFAMPPPDTSARAAINREPSTSRSDPGRGKSRAPAALDPQRFPPVPQAPAPSPAGAGASSGSGGGFAGGLFAALVGTLIVLAPGLGRVVSLSLASVRPLTLVGVLERPD
jgi:hypothetical protein